MEINDQKKSMANALIHAYMQGREDAFKAVKDSLDVLIEERGLTKAKTTWRHLKTVRILLQKKKT